MAVRKQRKIGAIAGKQRTIRTWMEDSMKRAALIVGVNKYEDPEINKLEYAENDAIELYSYFRNRPEYEHVEQMMSPDSEELLDLAHSMAMKLSAGDLLLLYFAGHGIEHEGQHLLLFPRVKHSRIDFMQQALPLRLLERETERSGLNRVMILDTCRRPLLHGARGDDTAAMRDVKCIQDMVDGLTAGKGALGTLCSCDEGQASMEVRDCRHGIFSLSLLEAMKELDRSGHDVSLSDELESAITRRMKMIGEEYGLSIKQRPWIKRSGELPALIEARSGRVQAGGNTTIVQRQAVESTAVRSTPVSHQKSEDTSKVYRHPEELDLIIPGSNKVHLKMKLIPAGSFMMGSPANEAGRDDDEDRHKVTITEPFYIGVYPVT